MADKADKGGKKDKAPKGDKAPKADKAAGDKAGEKTPKGDKAAGDKAPKGDKKTKGDEKKAGDEKKDDKKDDKKKTDKKGDDKKAEKKGDEKKAEKKGEKKEEKEKEEEEAGDEETPAEGGRKRAPFRRFFFRGLEVHKLLDLSHAELMKLMHARARRRFARGHVPMNLIRRLRKAKKDAPEGEKPKVVKTHLRNMIIVPEMVASVVGVYNGMSFTQVEIKPDMIGHYLGEFSISYKPVKHGRPGVGATNSSRIIPLK